MKILHINSYYSVGSFYKNLYDLQVNADMDIDVFVPVSTGFKKKDFNYGEYTMISKTYHKLDRIVFHLKHHKILKNIKETYDLEKFSLIHAHSLFSNGYVAMKLKEQYGIPYIVALRNTDVNVFFKKMIHLRKMGIKILKDSDQIIFLSDSYRDFVLEKYIPEAMGEAFLAKSHIVPNGIDEFWFKNIGEPKDIKSHGEIKLIQVGDINKNKNIETTIKALDILNERGYKTTLDVVGKVKDQKIFDVIKNSKSVKYLGYKSKEDLIKVYKDNDIFILPSIKESFGLVYPEAMSQGLPVIYTRGQGFDRQFKEGEVGYSVLHDSSENIADAIIKIIKDYRVMSTNSITYVHKFDWTKIESKYQEIYKKVSKARKRT